MEFSKELEMTKNKRKIWVIVLDYVEDVFRFVVIALLFYYFFVGKGEPIASRLLMLIVGLIGAICQTASFISKTKRTIEELSE